MKEPSSKFPNRAPMDRVARFQSHFFYISLRVPSKQGLTINVTFLSRSPVQQRSFRGPPKKPVFRAFLYISFRIPRKAALPPGSPRRAHFCYFSNSPEKELPFQLPQWGEYGERCLSPEPSFIYPSRSPVKEPSLHVPLAESS